MIADVALVSIASLVVVALFMALTALTAQRENRVAVVDVAWGSAFVLVAIAGLAAGTLTDGSLWRRLLLLVLTGGWGLRLALHILRRSRGHTADDPRYVEMLGGTIDQVGMGLVVRKVFVVQGVAIWFISLPVQVGAALPADHVVLVVLGVLLWVVGVVFESVGDAQLTAYRSLPKDRKPIVMETGLWRFTRHPNYFGDACVWWGLWLVGGLGSGWVAGLATVLCPIAMTYFLLFATGARLLEKTMMQRPGYPEYAARTSMFLPLPPRKKVAA